MSNRNKQDEISDLLDSFEDEDVLERKMDRFAKRTHRHAQEQEQEPEPLISVGDTTQVLSREDLEAAKKSSQEGETMMWDASSIDQESQDTNSTVVINDEEIQSLIDENKGPVTQREYVHHKHVQTEPRRPEPQTKKTIVMIVAAIIGVALTGLLVFGLIKFVTSGLTDKTEETEQTTAYEDLKSWIDSYSTFTDTALDEIEDYESRYNSLSKDQQKEIDEMLKEKTGSTFNELLAKAKSADKVDSSNNNTKVAEQKAQLNNKIQDLKSQLSDAQQTLEEATSKQSKAKAKVDEIQAKIDTANTNIATAQKTYDDAYAAFNTAYTRWDELYKRQNDPDFTGDEFIELSELNGKLDGLEKAYKDAESELESVKSENDTTALNQELTNAKKELDSLNTEVSSAQSSYDSINSQLQNTQNQLNNIKG